MRTKHNQQGLGLVVLILIIVLVGTIGFMGWYVWQNNKTNDTSLEEPDIAITDTVITDSYEDNAKIEPSTLEQNIPTVDSSTSAQKALPGSTVTLSQTQSVKVDGDTKSVVVPQGWIVETGIDQPNDELPPVVTLIAPDKNVFVQYRRLGGLGGRCEPEENPQTLKKVQITDMVNYDKIKLVEYYVSDGKSYYGYVSNIVTTQSANKILENANRCNAYLADMIFEMPGFENTRFGIYSKNFNTMNEAEQPISQSQYDAFRSSEAYRAAKAIVLSLKKV